MREAGVLKDSQLLSAILVTGGMELGFCRDFFFF